MGKPGNFGHRFNGYLGHTTTFRSKMTVIVVGGHGFIGNNGHFCNLFDINHILNTSFLTVRNVESL